MPLPDKSVNWPPENLDRISAKYAEWSAWYANDTEALSEIYSTERRNNVRPSGRTGGVVGVFDRFFWGKRNNDLTQPQSKLHVPVASDICQASADLLFSDSPDVSIAEDETTEEAEARLELIADAKFHETMVSAAEIAAALGGVFLRATVDESVEDHAFITKLDVDGAAPEFRYGRLSAVTFWQVVERDGQRVVRHLERHETDAANIGVIYHGLYQGTPDKLGNPIPLEDHPVTEGLAQWVNAEKMISTETEGLAVEFIPNLTPNRIWRDHQVGAHLGRSDLDGIEPLMDKFDEAWSSWMRDLEQGKGRLLVGKGALKNQGPGQGAGFDADQSIYTELSVSPGSKADEKMQVEQVQFDIRVAEHEQTTLALFKAIVRNAGYSASSFGEGEEGAAMTATEVTARASRSYMTRDRKIRSLQPGAERILSKALAMDAVTFGTGVKPVKVNVSFGDAVQESLEALARIAQLMSDSMSASMETRVRVLHPEWTDTKVEEEVERIKAENKQPTMADPDTLGEDGQGLSDRFSNDEDQAAGEEDGGEAKGYRGQSPGPG